MWGGYVDGAWRKASRRCRCRWSGRFVSRSGRTHARPCVLGSRPVVAVVLVCVACLCQRGTPRHALLKSLSPRSLISSLRCSAILPGAVVPM